MDQLEWGDHLVLHPRNKNRFYNPAGLYIHLIKENAIPPETFETRRKQNLREAALRARHHEQEQLATLQLAYMDYRSQELDCFIETNFTSQEFMMAVEAKKKEMLQQTYWRRILASKHDDLEKAASRQVRMSTAGTMKFMTFEEFCQKRPREQEHQNEPTANPAERSDPLAIRVGVPTDTHESEQWNPEACTPH